jgi:hypothetical protein
MVYKATGISFDWNNDGVVGGKSSTTTYTSENTGDTVGSTGVSGFSSSTTTTTNP